MRYEEILKLKVEDHDMDIRQYLGTLLLTLWSEGESFSGKSPFGDSGWEWDLYTPLVKNGFVTGTFDNDGDIEDFSMYEADSLVSNLIRYIFLPNHVIEEHKPDES